MTSSSWKNEIRYPGHACKHCGEAVWRVGFYIDAGGNPKYPFVCVACGRRTPQFAQRKAVERSGIEVLELHPMQLPFVCEVCGAEGAENHHWAPFYLFGEEADMWPQSYLCPACHRRWHEVVTPRAGG